MNLNDFNQFRIITNMERYEYKNENKIYEKEAGIKLIKELKNCGYKNSICIYDKLKTKVIEKCKNNGLCNEKIVYNALDLKGIKKWILPLFEAQNLIQREDIVKFKATVAIDFGTHGTGLGYALINDDEKTQETYIEQDWCSNVDNKNKTDILLKYDGTFLAFGEKALNMYLYGDNESDSNSDEEEKEEDEKEDLNKKNMLF